MAKKTLSEIVADAADSPDAASTDGFSSTARSIPDLIALEQHEAKKAAAARGGLPIRIGKIRPPGAV